MIAGVPAGVLTAVAFSLHGITDDKQVLSVRRHDRAIFGIALVVGAVVVWFAAWLAARSAARIGDERRRSLTRAGLFTFAALLVGCLIAYAAVTGPTGWVHQFRNHVGSQTTLGKTRFTSTSSGNRWFWWQEAWNAFVDHPLNGTGAGTFEITHRIRRTNALVATEPHQLPLQFMTETGIVGFLLAAGAAVAAFFGLWRVLGPARSDRPARVRARPGRAGVSRLRARRLRLGLRRGDRPGPVRHGAAPHVGRAPGPEAAADRRAGRARRRRRVRYFSIASAVGSPAWKVNQVYTALDDSKPRAARWRSRHATRTG